MMSIKFTYIPILICLIKRILSYDIVLDRNFGTKIYCWSGLEDVAKGSDGPIAQWVSCDRSCYSDTFEKTIAVSLQSVYPGSDLFLALDMSKFTQPYSYLNVEYTHFAGDPVPMRILSAFPLVESQKPVIGFEEFTSVVCIDTYGNVGEPKQVMYNSTSIPESDVSLSGSTYNYPLDKVQSDAGNSDSIMLRSIFITTNCVQNCQVCETKTSCEVCQAGYARHYLESTGEYVCEITAHCVADNCFTCTVDGPDQICRSCYPGFTLDSTNLCQPNTSDTSICTTEFEYFEDGKCLKYSSKAYVETKEIGDFLEVSQLTAADIQLMYRCASGTVVFISRIDNYTQYSCRCLVEHCQKCSARTSCDRCASGYSFDASRSQCVKASFTSNSWQVQQKKTDSGFEIRAKFNENLLYTKLTSDDFEVTINDFNEFTTSFDSLEGNQTILLKVKMLGYVKNRTLKVKLTNSEFIDTNLITNTEASIRLPAYVYVSDSDKESAETAKSIGVAASGAIVGTLLIIVIISNFSAVVATIDLTGFLYYLLYIEARFPENIVSFYAVFKNFQMDFIPNPFTDLVTPGYMQLSEVRFMQSDTDAYFLTSTGQSITIFLLIVMMYFIAKIMAKLDIPFLSAYFQKSIYETWEFGGYFDAVWTIYIYLLIGVLMQFQGFDCSDSSCGWNYFLFSISFIVSFGIPALIVKLIRDNPNLKDNQYMQTKLSSLIAGVKLYSVKEQSEVLDDSHSKLTIWRDTYSKKYTKYYMPFLYLRKIIFSLIIMCLSSSGYAQLTLITLLNVAMAAYFLLLRPLDSQYENYKGAISEIVMIVFQILVGILIQDPDTQEEEDRINIGWVAIAIISLVILWHTVGIIFDFLVAIWSALKAMYAKKFSAKVTPISQEELQESPQEQEKSKGGSDPKNSQSMNNQEKNEGDMLHQSSDMLNGGGMKKKITLQQSFTNRQLLGGQQSFSQLDIGNESPMKTRDGGAQYKSTLFFEELGIGKSPS